MSMFWCARCDEIADSDEGCDEYKGTQLICIDCMNEIEGEEDEAYRTASSPAEEYERVERMRAEMKRKMEQQGGTDVSETTPEYHK